MTLTEKGQKAFKDYVAYLESILSLKKTNER